MFAVEMEALKSRSDTVRHAEAGELAGLKAAVAGFQEVLADHHRALKAAKTITERLVTAIGNEVARRDRPFGPLQRERRGPTPGAPRSPGP